MPLNANKDLLVQMILGHQARVLTERAQKAIQELHPPHIDDHLRVDVLSVDASALQPHSTAYSTSGNRLNQSTTGSSTGSAGQTDTATASIRSRIKQQMGLRKVGVVCQSCDIHMISVHQAMDRHLLFRVYRSPWNLVLHVTV